MPQESASRAIQIRVDEVSQLFNTLDPFLFRERDLNPEAEEFIVGWARELPKTQPITILVHAPESESNRATAPQVKEALNRYFSYREERLTLDLKELFRVGRLSLLIGVTVLAVCLLLAQTAPKYPDLGPIGRFLEEGLIILGWVANWKPIEIFLYDWWPLAQRRNLYRRLGKADVEVGSNPSEGREARTGSARGGSLKPSTS